MFSSLLIDLQTLNILNTKHCNLEVQMNKIELRERLELLCSTDVISEVAATVADDAFDHLAKELDQAVIAQSEMLFTHLPTALTRLERGEKIEGPPEALLNEAKGAGFVEKVNNEIDFIEARFNHSLPDAEKDYLHLHYATVFQQNKDGEENENRDRRSSEQKGN